MCQWFCCFCIFCVDQLPAPRFRQIIWSFAETPSKRQRPITRRWGENQSHRMQSIQNRSDQGSRAAGGCFEAVAGGGFPTASHSFNFLKSFGDCIPTAGHQRVLHMLLVLAYYSCRCLRRSEFLSSRFQKRMQASFQDIGKRKDQNWQVLFTGQTPAMSIFQTLLCS